MSSLIEPEDGEGVNARVFGVSELSGALKRTIEDRFGYVRVRGELGRIVRHRSGHVYLDLKDERACLAAVVWRGQAARLGMTPEQGDEVVAEGRLTTFPGQSKYQLVIERMAYAGEGALLAKLERAKRALAAEGLFDEARKRAIPFLPRVIGVVTSPSGAVIRDILHRLADRFPMEVLLWPAAVQGPACAGEVAKAVAGFDALEGREGLPRPDLLIVARGGGSVEDLWGFNEEIVARAVAACRIPVISAVGHETDTTLIDFVADRRAPTPTAAAEMAAPVRRELLADLAQLEARRRRALGRLLEDRGRRLRDLARVLPAPEALLAEARQRLDRAEERLPRALLDRAARARLALRGGVAGRFRPRLLRDALDRAGARRDAALAALRREARGRGREGLRLELRRLDRRLIAALDRGRAGARAGFERLSCRLAPARVERRREVEAIRVRTAAARLDRALDERLGAALARAAQAGRLLDTLSHKATLNRGFALVRDGEGALVPRAAALVAGAALELEFADGRRRAVAEGAPRRPRRRGEPAEQETLF